MAPRVRAHLLRLRLRRLSVLTGTGTGTVYADAKWSGRFAAERQRQDLCRGAAASKTFAAERQPAGPLPRSGSSQDLCRGAATRRAFAAERQPDGSRGCERSEQPPERSAGCCAASAAPDIRIASKRALGFEPADSHRAGVAARSGAANAAQDPCRLYRGLLAALAPPATIRPPLRGARRASALPPATRTHFRCVQNTRLKPGATR